MTFCDGNAKARLRHDIAALKHLYSDKELMALSEAAVGRLEQNTHIKEAAIILLYHSIRGEVYTHALISRLYAMGKTILLPRMKGDGRMVLAPYDGHDSLGEAAAFHILEPQGPPFTHYDDIGVAVVPGMAFTNDGRRLGRGGGYYDRLLPSLHNAYKIGLCFPFQIVKDVPTDENDVPMDTVVC